MEIQVGPFQGPDSIFPCIPEFAPGVIQIGPLQGPGGTVIKALCPNFGGRAYNDRFCNHHNFNKIAVGPVCRFVKK